MRCATRSPTWRRRARPSTIRRTCVALARRSGCSWPLRWPSRRSAAWSRSGRPGRDGRRPDRHHARDRRAARGLGGALAGDRRSRAGQEVPRELCDRPQAPGRLRELCEPRESPGQEVPRVQATLAGGGAGDVGAGDVCSLRCSAAPRGAPPGPVLCALPEPVGGRAHLRLAPRSRRGPGASPPPAARARSALDPRWLAGGPMNLILLVILIVLLVGALPHYPYSTGWGYYPSGGIGLILLILLILVLLGRV